MRVAELVGIRQFRLVDQVTPDPAPGEVQVQVQAVGICGSDMHSYAEGGIGDTRCRYPMVLGHEPAGVVRKVGAGVTGWSAGAQVVCEPAIYCYHCELCRMGRHNLCSAVRFMSTPTEPGFFRQVVNLPVGNLLALPAGLSAREGALVEPISIALHSLALAAPGVGESAVVIGAGPIGLMTTATLRLAGAGRIFVIEPLPHRREMAKALGADVALGVEDAVGAVLADTAARGVDLVYDCAAKSDTHNQALRLARPGGRVVYTGIPSEMTLAIDMHLWRRKELAIYNVRRSNHEGHPALDLLARHPKLFAPVVTHSRPLEGISAAFATLERYEDGVGKLVVCPEPA
jgi:L-iditol 2-dehydrogenase